MVNSPLDADVTSTPVASGSVTFAAPANGWPLGTATFTLSCYGTSSGNDAYTDSATITVRLPCCEQVLTPPAPTGVAATNLAATPSGTCPRVRVSWNAVTDAVRYRVEQQQSGAASWAEAGTTASTSLGVTGLSRNTTYWFRVRAIGDGSPYLSTEYGSPSTAASVTTASCFPALSAPAATAGTDGTSIAVGYTLPASGYNYQLQLWSVSGKTSTEQASHNITVPTGSTFPYGGSHTFTGLAASASNSHYEAALRACRPPGHTDCSERKYSLAVRLPGPPVITIAPQKASVTEGDEVRFTLTASRALGANLTVDVDVAETGGFLTGAIPSQITIAGGDATAELILQTTDDIVDETNGSVTAEITTGTGYRVGNPSSGSVTVEDDDIPPAPPRLRINGDLTADGSVTLRWSPVSAATAYNVRYVEEVCEDGDCAPEGGSTPNWQTLTGIATTNTGVAQEATLGGLTAKKLYRVEVQAVIVDASAWSNFAFVFPTNVPPGRSTEVGTAPFHGYQSDGRFRYVLCENTIPAGLTMTAADMKDAVDEWEDTVVWDSGGVNIIRTEAPNLSMGQDCSIFPIPEENGRFEVKFVSDNGIKSGCNPPGHIGLGMTPDGCWRSDSWFSNYVRTIESGSVLLRAELGAAQWNTNVAVGCARLHEILVHEVGHAFGIGDWVDPKFNRHPTNTIHSVMSYDDPDRDCTPQAYDIVALMALYQSQ